MSQTEKIARMVGKTTYKDFREGFAMGTLPGDGDADIKGALGMAQRATSALAVQVLETRYASTLAHERVIRRAWDRHLNDAAKQLKVKRDSQTVARQRMAAALSIRQLAGAKMIHLDVAEYAWLMNTRRADMEEMMARCTVWLTDLCAAAERAFREAIADDESRPTAKARAA